MIRGVLFDMDGLLLDTERLGMELMPQLARELGYELPQELYYQLMGQTKEADKRILCEFFGSDFPCDELLCRFSGRQIEVGKTGKLPFKKGYQACMDGLRARHIPCALATGSERAVVETYQRYNPALNGVFQAMICGSEATRSKPEPDIYLQAASALGLAPGECIGAEDSRNGVRSLRAAGCHSVMIPDLLAFDQSLAPYVDNVLNDLSELCPLIDRLNGV